MTDLRTTDNLFFAKGDLDRDRLETQVNDALGTAEDGELFLEYRQSESLVWDDGRLRSANFDTAQGFGLRAVADEATAFSHSNELSNDAVGRAAETVKAVGSGRSGKVDLGSIGTNISLYSDVNPLGEATFEAKVDLLAQIDAYARSRDPRVVQVSASISGNWQAVQIWRSGGQRIGDIRPLVRFNVSVVVKQGDRMETGSHGEGGRIGYDGFFDEKTWKKAVDESLRQAVVNLDSVAAPAGEMTVVLGPGWPGILLHEAIGHGLEGDFNRKGTSAFAGLLGQRIASPGVTVVDDGTIHDRRGSLSIDDEGTPTQQTVLIEDGILKGFMQDRLNARLTGVKSTGNGRRQSYAHAPMPRMTNT
ncbi:TldD/PmbA family protein, partial [Thalassospira sp. UBA848]